MSDEFDDLFRDVIPIENEGQDTNLAVETTEDAPAEHVEEVAGEAQTDSPAIEPQETEEADEDKVSPFVPVGTFLGMKDKYRDEKEERIRFEAEATALKQRLAEYEARQSHPNVETPDPYMDPKGYADFRFAAVEKQRLHDKIALSGEFAKRTHGEAVVREAANWAAAQANLDPRFDQAVTSQPDPIEWVIQQHKAAIQLDAFQRDPEAFARKVAMEKGWLTAEPALASNTAQAAIQSTNKTERKAPLSLTDVPAANAATKATHVKPVEDLNSLFR